MPSFLAISVNAPWGSKCFNLVWLGSTLLEFAYVCLAIAKVKAITNKTSYFKIKSLKMLQINETGTISERILQLVNHFHQGNKTAFGRAANIQSGVLAGIVGGRSSKPGFEILQKLLTAYPTVNPNWLLFGRDEMLLVNEPIPTVEETHPHLMGSSDTTRVAGFNVPINREQERARWQQYYNANAQYTRTVTTLKALVEYLAKTDSSPELRGILDLLPMVINPPLSPDKQDQLDDAEWEMRMEQWHAEHPNG